MKNKTPHRIDSEGRRERHHSLVFRLLFSLFIIGTTVFLLGVAGVIGLFFFYGREANLPRFKNIHDYQPSVVTRIFDRNNILIGEISAERRTVVPYQKIPKLMVQAVVAAEDAAFFQHRGLNYLGMLRAFIANIRSARFHQGGSSITQQVVKTFLLTPERTIKRKIQEVILARRLENELSKEEILYLYLNQIYFGHGRYGVQEASRFFFSKDVNLLNVGEMAVLAGLPQSPERLSPFKHPEMAKRRQLYVLGRMAKEGFISEEQAKKWRKAPLPVVYNPRLYLNEAPEVTDIIKAELVRTFGDKKLSRMGLQIQATLDVKLQLAARDAVQWGLMALDARQGYRRRVGHGSGKRLTQLLTRLQSKQASIKPNKRYQAVVLAVHDENEELEIDLGSQKGKVLLQLDNNRYNPQHLPATKRFQAGDIIWVRGEDDYFRFDGGPQAAMVVMEPQTGEVLAMVGGYDFQSGSYNRATQALRQPGSAFKPFIYAAALDSKQFTASSILDDAPVVFGTWEPRNYDGQYRGPLRLRQGLTYSINTVTARLLDMIKVEPVQKLAAAMGITSPLINDLSLALGSSEVKPIDLTVAYCAIANGGFRVEPHYLLRMGNQAVKRPNPKSVLRPEVAFILTSLLESVIQEGTGRRAAKLNRPVAGKTGTTNEQKDAWFAGFTPQMVAVVWVGFDEPQPLGKKEAGSQAALPVWLHFMQTALKGQPKLPFKQPSGIVVQRIDPATGLLAPEGATDTMEEFFIQGTEPKETAQLPGQVNPDTILMNPDTP